MALRWVLRPRERQERLEAKQDRDFTALSSSQLLEVHFLEVHFLELSPSYLFL